MPFSYTVSVAPLVAGIAALNAQNVLILADTGAILTDTGTTLPGTLAAILLDTGTTLPADLATIIADIAANYARMGAPAGASMSADIAAVLAASGTTFTEYACDTALANGTTFTPPAGTIIMVHMLNTATVDAANEFVVQRVGVKLTDSFLVQETPLFDGFSRTIYYDGTNMRILNNTGAEKNLMLYGVSI